jgi:hypothetical protein
MTDANRKKKLNTFLSTKHKNDNKILKTEMNLISFSNQTQVALAPDHLQINQMVKIAWF